MKTLSGFLAIALAVALTGVATAQTSDNPGTTDTRTEMNNMDGTSVSGTVSSVYLADNTFTISTDAGNSMTFSFDGNANVPQTLAVGQRVRVGYNGDLGANNRYEARMVTVDVGTGTPGTTAAPGATTGTTTYERSTTTTTDRTMSGSTDSRDASGATQHEQNRYGSTAGNTARMPATASPLPLIGMLGGLALAGAAGVRMLVRR